MGRTVGAPKTGGRKKGSKNKTTVELKSWVFDFVSDFLLDNMQKKEFKEKFKSLDIDVQFAIVTKLIPFVLAKQTENKISLDDELTKVIKESSAKINEMFK